MDDLEDMMMMEAIRLSLASEEERRKKEEKDARKEAKKKDKESKKAEKAARKSSLFTVNSNTSIGDSATSLMERSRSNLSLEADDDSVSGKGKSVERGGGIPMERSLTDEESHRPPYLPALSLSGTSQESLASSIPVPLAAEPFRRSHLRQMSNASSASSSFVESGPATFSGNGTPPPGSLEPMFNFRSLAAMIGEDEKGDDSAHVENAGSDRDSSPSSLDVPEKAQSSARLANTTRSGDSSSDASLEPDSRKNSAEEPPAKQAEVRLENAATATDV